MPNMKAFTLSEYMDSLRASFLMPYPAIWNTLGVDKSNVKTILSIQGDKGVLEFLVPGPDKTHIAVVVIPDRKIHEVYGFVMGAEIPEARFPYRAGVLGFDRGVQGDISRYIAGHIPTARVVYEVVGVGGSETYDDLGDLLRNHRQVGLNHSGRKELRGQPELDGLSGPMFDGRVRDTVKIRYETDQAYELHSRAAGDLKVASAAVAKRDIRIKNGDVIPRGTKARIEFILGNARMFRLAFDFVGPSGRDYEREPMTTTIRDASEIVTGIAKPPGISALQRMSDNSIATTPTGKRVEPDGWASDGSPSWLLVMGMI